MQETQKTWAWSLGREDPLEQEMATHSSILAWKTPRTTEPVSTAGHGLALLQPQVSHTRSKTPLLNMEEEVLMASSKGEEEGGLLHLPTFPWLLKTSPLSSWGRTPLPAHLGLSQESYTSKLSPSLSLPLAEFFLCWDREPMLYQVAKLILWFCFYLYPLPLSPPPSSGNQKSDLFIYEFVCWFVFEA